MQSSSGLRETSSLGPDILELLVLVAFDNDFCIIVDEIGKQTRVTKHKTKKTVKFKSLVRFETLQILRACIIIQSKSMRKHSLLLEIPLLFISVFGFFYRFFKELQGNVYFLCL